MCSPVGLTFMISLPQSFKYWNYGHGPHRPVNKMCLYWKDAKYKKKKIEKAGVLCIWEIMKYGVWRKFQIIADVTPGRQVLWQNQDSSGC